MIEKLLDKWVLATLLIFGLVVYTTFVVVREHVAINKFGGRASVFKGKLPFGKTPYLRYTWDDVHIQLSRDGYRLDEPETHHE